MAAALVEAPDGAAGATWMCEYLFSIPLTASKTAVCTMAADRVTLSGLVPATTFARSICSAQSVTSSARATPGINVAEAKRTAARTPDLFITVSLQLAGHECQRANTRRRSGNG